MDKKRLVELLAELDLRMAIMLDDLEGETMPISMLRHFEKELVKAAGAEIELKTFSNSDLKTIEEKVYLESMQQPRGDPAYIA